MNGPRQWEDRSYLPFPATRVRIKHLFLNRAAIAFCEVPAMKTIAPELLAPVKTPPDFEGGADTTVVQPAPLQELLHEIRVDCRARPEEFLDEVIASGGGE